MAKAKSNSRKKTTPAGSGGSTIQHKSEMKTSEIRDLIDFISQSGLNEVNIETKELKLHVKREPDQKVFKSTPVVTAAIPQQTTTHQIAATNPIAVEPKVEKAASSTTTVDIKSPMIGTFYRSANPDSPLFASVGDKITKGQTVCIIEAMKLFNEIESEVSGTIVRVALENASPVEYDQVLFVVQPD